MAISKYRRNNKFLETAFIYENSQTTDGDTGENCIVKTQVLAAPAMITNKRVNEVVGDSTLNVDAPAGVRITIRHDFNSDVEFNSNMIIEVRGRSYRIIGFFEDDFNRVVKFDVSRISG